MAPSRPVFPFLTARDGRPWGKPADDATAIAELEAMRRSGVSFIATAWPAFWWLDHYESFARYLRTSFHCAHASPNAIVFDLRKAAEVEPAYEAFAAQARTPSASRSAGT